MRRIAPLLAVLLLAGRGGDSATQREEVESLIRGQLPESVRRNTGEAVFVNEVTCASKGDNEFDCIARMTGTDGGCGLQNLDVPVPATCDEENCTWRSTG